MRVSFVLPGRGLHGGIRVVAFYAERLIERGHQATIVVFGPSPVLRPRPFVRRVWRGLRRGIGLDRDHLDGISAKVVTCSRRALASRVTDGDAVVATHWLTAEPVAALPAAKGCKYYFIQGDESRFFDPAAVEATWRLPMQKIVVARWLADLAREQFGDDGAVVVPNGVDRTLFDAPSRGPHEPPVVGFTYSRSPWKASDVAVEAIERAREVVPALRVVSFGAETPSADRPLPRDTDFTLRPAQSAIRTLYARADVWLCSSTCEGFGLPPLEAMACRCPVISTRCGGPSDFMVDGENGFLVDVGDATAMADRLATLVTDRDGWSRMSEAAYATAGRFSWPRSVERFEAVLQGRPLPNEPSTRDTERALTEVTDRMTTGSQVDTR